MKKVTLAVVVPVYNVEEYLEECLNSIINQTEAFDQVILVNDGSADRSRTICEKYCQNNRRLILLDQKNQGQATARNVGMRLLETDYVIFVDSDDYLARDTVDILKKALQKEEQDILFYNANSFFDVISDDTSAINTRINAKDFVHDSALDYRRMKGMDFIKETFPGNYTASVCVAAYRVEFLKRNNITFPEGVVFEDEYFSIQAVTKAETLMCIPNFVYHRRYRKESVMTSRLTEKKCKDMTKVQLMMWSYLIREVNTAENSAFIKRRIAFGLRTTLEQLQKFEDSEVVVYCVTQLRDFFAEKRESMPENNEWTWGEVAAAMDFLLTTKKLDLEEQESGNVLEELANKLKSVVRQKLEALPFNKEEIYVGVYGIGKHTEAILSLYESCIAPVRCKMVFIVTQCEENSTYKECPLVSVKSPEVFRLSNIILSSMVYQSEMYDALISEKIDAATITCLYNQQDICDLLYVYEVMQEYENVKAINQ